jgi:hypothetical protein
MNKELYSLIQMFVMRVFGSRLSFGAYFLLVIGALGGPMTLSCNSSSAYP